MIKLINTAFTLRTFLTEIEHSIVLPLSLHNALNVKDEQAHLSLDPLNYKVKYTRAMLAQSPN
jgi:hypothetical protein